MVLAVIIIYTVGLFWLAYYLKTGFIKTMTIGFLPFILGDVIKVIICLTIVKPLIKIVML